MVSLNFILRLSILLTIVSLGIAHQIRLPPGRFSGKNKFLDFQEQPQVTDAVRGCKVDKALRTMFDLLAGVKLVSMLLHVYVERAVHPILEDPCVFISLDREFENQLATGQLATEINSTSLLHEIMFDLPPRFQGFQIRLRTAPLSDVVLYMPIVEEKLAKKVFTGVFQDKWASQPKEKEPDTLSREWNGVALVLDYFYGHLYIRFNANSDPPGATKLLFRVMDIVKSYLEGWENTVTPFKDLPLAAASAPCPLCSSIDAVDSYVRISKSLIKAMHTPAVKEQLSRHPRKLSRRPRECCLMRCFRWLTRKFKKKKIIIPPEVYLDTERRKQRVLAEWLPITVTPLQNTSDVKLAEGVLFVPNKNLIIYKAGVYHEYKYVNDLPQGLRNSSFVRSIFLSVTCEEGRHCQLTTFKIYM